MASLKAGDLPAEQPADHHLFAIASAVNRSSASRIAT
jgi:hypothetical protein